MKHIYILAALMVLPSFILVAKNDDDKPKSNGFRGGFQTSNMFGDISNTNNYNSYYLGFFGERKILPLIHLGTGLEYGQSGFVSSNLDNTKWERYILSVPIYGKLKLGPVFLTGGLAANFKVGEKYTFLGQKTDLNEDEKSKVFDLPLQLGLGFKIAFITIDARAYWGMLNQSNQDNKTIKANYVQVGAAISF